MGEAWMEGLYRGLAALLLTCLLGVGGCDDPVMDAARAADFHDGPAGFISEMVRPEDAKRRDLTLRVNFSDSVPPRTVLAVMRALPALYQGERAFQWYRMPERFRQGKVHRCRRVPSPVGGLPIEECKHSSLYTEGAYKIWPDKGKPPRPYRSRAEALNELRLILKGAPDLELFYCGRTPNSCAPVKLPPLAF